MIQRAIKKKRLALATGIHRIRNVSTNGSNTLDPDRTIRSAVSSAPSISMLGTSSYKALMKHPTRDHSRNTKHVSVCSQTQFHCRQMSICFAASANCTSSRWIWKRHRRNMHAISSPYTLIRFRIPFRRCVTLAGRPAGVSTSCTKWCSCHQH